MTSEQIASLQPALAALLERFRECFKRDKTFGYWQTYILGLMADLKRKSIEPIALAAGLPVRTLQEFLAFFAWDHGRIDRALQRLVAEEHGSDRALGVLDSSGHPKQGDKTPGVQHQYCGEHGKQENCVMGQHLLYTDNDAANPFSCVLASDLYLPKSWVEDRPRCREAGIPDTMTFRPKWEIGIDQLARAVASGVRFSYVVFDEDYGRVPAFWFALDRLGQRGVGEVPGSIHGWATPPRFRSGRAEHGSKRIDRLVTYSPVFTRQEWQTVTVKDTTRGPSVWRVKAARIQLVAGKHPTHRGPSIPTDHRYWLVVAENVRSGERKYILSNATGPVDPADLLGVLLARWHIEKWFERAKQECGFGAFEVRTYTSLIRHWLSARMAMFFLACQTRRLRGEKSADHTGTGRRRGQYIGLEDMAAMGPLMADSDRAMRLLPMA